MAWLKNWAAKQLAARRPEKPRGYRAKAAILKFLEDMKPHLAKAGLGVTVMKTTSIPHSIIRIR